MKTEMDLVIIGAGCAGLSLGMQLAKLGKISPETVLLEPRTSFENDRTWSFWGNEKTALSGLASHHWNRFLVQANSKSVAVDCSFAPYYVLPARRFYDHALEQISSNDLLKIETGVSVIGDPQLVNEKWSVKTTTGDFIAKTVVDTRPFPIDSQHGATLWQSFLGCEIESTDALFDPQVAHLMDFCAANADYVGFTYLLPLTPTKALIEFTVFAKRPYFKDELQGNLDNSVLQYTQGSQYVINRTEVGLIPMGIPYNPRRFTSSDNYIFAGLTSGAARPATGYAFQRIQIWAEACAISLGSNRTPVGHQTDALLLRAMDTVFLKVIRNCPKLAPDLFISLFSKVESRKLIRFLSDQGSLLDCIAVINALPPGPFIQHIFKR
ncbi:lycopene beta-cyclase [Oxalobacteraceae bacterium GrIS 2.11]